MALKKTLLRSRDVAHVLDCSPDDAVELARRGKLKGTKTVSYWRFRLEDVIAYKSNRGNDLLTS